MDAVAVPAHLTLIAAITELLWSRHLSERHRDRRRAGLQQTRSITLNLVILLLSFQSMNVIYDSDWSGLVDDGAEPILYKCEFVAAKFVGFEGYNTGRRFLSCEGQEELKCDFLQWVDPVPTDAMMKTVGKLWDMYGEVKQAKTTESLNFMEQKFDYQDKINKLHTDLRISQDELAKQVEEKQVTLAHKAIAEQGLMDARATLEEKRITDETTCKMHKCLLKKAENDRDKYKEDKRKLESIISDLLKQKEAYKRRFKKIKDLCDV